MTLNQHSALIALWTISSLFASVQAETLDYREKMADKNVFIQQTRPRIEPLQPSEISPEAVTVLTEMRKAIHSTPPETIPESLAIMANHPLLMRRQIQLSSQLHNGVLSPQDREMAILRIAWLCQAPYEWGEHVAIGKRVAGLSTEDIERITKGSSAAGWTAHESAVLSAVEELYETATISEETWAELQRTLNNQQLYELPVVVGTYQTFAYMHKSIQFRLNEGNTGLNMR